MKLLAVTALLSVAIATPTAYQKRAVPAKTGFKLTWYDDFTGPKGTFPSDSKWNCMTGTSYPGGPAQWGNNELQTYRRDYSNLVTTASQTMSIRAQKAADGTWTSGRIESKTDFLCAQSGKMYIETRVKMGSAAAANQQGIWPAFWALGSAFKGNYNNWPQVSEWDIVESINGQNTLYSVLHCGPNGQGGPCNEYVGRAQATPFTRTNWNVIGFQVDRSMTGVGKTGTWKDEELSWWLNGTKVFSIKGKDINDYNTWVQIAQRSHYLIFNVAVGGNWAQAPNAQTIGGDTTGMEIDYVAVWNT